MVTWSFEITKYFMLILKDQATAPSGLRKKQMSGVNQTETKKIVKDGQIHVLPNGVFGLNKGDGIVCATSNFYKYLTNEGILADALVSGTCSDWMNLMVRRISDQCQLKCGNLSAVTLMLND